MMRVDPLVEVYKLLLRLADEAEQKKTVAVFSVSQAGNTTTAGATEAEAVQQVDSSPLRQTVQVREVGHDHV